MSAELDTYVVRDWETLELPDGTVLGPGTVVQRHRDVRRVTDPFTGIDWQVELAHFLVVQGERYRPYELKLIAHYDEPWK